MFWKYPNAYIVPYAVGKFIVPYAVGKFDFDGASQKNLDDAVETAFGLGKPRSLTSQLVSGSPPAHTDWRQHRCHTSCTRCWSWHWRGCFFKEVVRIKRHKAPSKAPELASGRGARRQRRYRLRRRDGRWSRGCGELVNPDSCRGSRCASWWRHFDGFG